MGLAAVLLIGSAVLGPDADTALEQIRAAEAHLRNAQFTMESQVCQPTSAGELVPSDQFSNVEGLVAPGVRAKCHAKIDAVLPGHRFMRCDNTNGRLLLYLMKLSQ